MARHWNTNATEVCGNPFSAVGRMRVVPAKRIAALVVVSGTTSTTGNLPRIDHLGGWALVFDPLVRGRERFAVGPNECRRRSSIFCFPLVNHGPGFVARLLPLGQFRLQFRCHLRRSNENVHVGAFRQGRVILGHDEAIFDHPWDHHVWCCRVVLLRSSGPLVLLDGFLDQLVFMMQAAQDWRRHDLQRLRKSVSMHLKRNRQEHRWLLDAWP
jgi:hypothetical protein